MSMLYRLEPFARPMVWAGNQLECEIPRDEASGHLIGEALEASALETMPSWAIDARGARHRLIDLFEEMGPALCGRGTQFPLLVKRLATADPLSLQVHPDDPTAKVLESAANGKTEAWVVLDAEPDAGVWLGFKEPVDEETMRREIIDESILDRMRYLPCRPGDVIPVPAGCAHAIDKGIFLYEVQQPSDLTYRIYDHGRGRELHLDKAFQCLKPELRPELQEPIELEKSPEAEIDLLLDMGAFRVERWSVKRQWKRSVPGLCVLHAYKGRARIEVDGELGEVKPRESLLVAQAASEVQIECLSSEPAQFLVAMHSQDSGSKR